MLGRSSPTSPSFFLIDVDHPGTLDWHWIGIGLLLSVSVSVLGLCKEAVAVISVTGFRCKVYPITGLKELLAKLQQIGWKRPC